MRRILCVCLLASLAACSKDKDPDVPAKLTAYTQKVQARRVWGTSVAGTSIPLRLGLELAALDGKVYAAGVRGEVAAIDLRNGHHLWDVHVQLPLGGGVSVADGQLVAGSIDGDVIDLDPATGEQRWRANVGSEIISTPAVSAKVVAVRTVDGKLHGLSTANGHELWQQQQTVPKLSLRGTAAPVVAGDMVLTGFDNGRVVATSLSDGASVWEQQLQLPQGKTEIERLVDIDSRLQVAGNDVYVVGYQGKVAMLQLDSGQTWWSHDASSYRAIAMDDDNIYLSLADGSVAALRRRDGSELWRQKALAHRGLSAPAVDGDYLVVADYQGYVHWLSRSTGEIVERVRAGKARYTNPPLVVDGMVLLINDRGQISAWRTRPLAKPVRRKK